MRPPSESDCVVCFVGTSDNTGHFANTTSRNNNRSEKYYQRKRFRHKLSYRNKRPQGGRMVMIFSSIVRLFRTIFIVLKQLLTLSKTKVVEYQAVRYCDCPLSPFTEARLLSVVPVRRKVMVLDLDETLIHSHHDNFNNASPPLVMKGIPDFCVQVYIENHPVQFYVYKRPHLDFFLTMICQWYDLVIFTASMQKYGMEVANHLDQNRGILPRRYFRQDCTIDMNGYTKDLTMVCEDLSNIFILDNSPSAYRGNPDNAIPIKSWFSDPTDTALLDLLPFLDCLRFTHDVRSVLSRNLHQHSLW